MNQKTAKLLRKYSNKSGKNIKELKDEWLKLPSKERAKFRQEILSTLNAEI